MLRLCHVFCSPLGYGRLEKIVGPISKLVAVLLHKDEQNEINKASNKYDGEINASFSLSSKS